MEPNIVLFDCSMKECDGSAVKLFEDSKLPHGVARTRKFIVLRNDQKVYIVIGPQFDENNSKDPAFYMHKDLRQMALFVLDKNGSHRYQIQGGGKIIFFGFTAQAPFAANFGGTSRDYGVYDSAILPYSRKIATWLQMTTTFEWKDRREPGKK